MNDMCTERKEDPRIHSDNAFFFTMLRGTIDQVVWVGMAFQLEAKLVWSNGPKNKKIRQTRGNRVGRQGWVFGFLIKIEVPPTHTLKEYVADTTYIDVDSVL